LAFVFVLKLVEVDRIELSSVVIPLQAFYYVKTISPPL